ncbi:MAG: FAD-dependent oxidoreductase [Cyanobacteria bacterium J06621_11]
MTEPATSSTPETSSEPAACPANDSAQNYDVIVFGDEVPGVMTALKVQQTLAAAAQSDRIAVITEGDTNTAIGGHLVRGGLAYLDRNQVPPDLRSQYGIFGTPSRLYQQFLQLGQVDTIALDRFTINDSFERSLTQADIDVIGNVDLSAVQTAGRLVCSLSADGETYTAQQFVDASQSGELAAASGVDMMQGLEALGFPDSTLSIGLVLDFFGVPIEALKQAENDLIGRLLDTNDAEAQNWLAVASGNNAAKQQDLLNSLLDNSHNPKLLYQGTPDSADVRSLAFSIAVHGQLGREYDLQTAGFLFDRANIAILDDRLSFNALLFYADAAEARALSTAGGKPTAEMLAVANEIKDLFERLAVPIVEIQQELYIRNAGQITNPIDELSATLMTAGGIPEDEALGTFGYHLDDRGGIDGLDEEVNESVIRLLNLKQMPVFNYGFRHTLPQERENLAVLGPASGFGGLGTTAGRIVEFNVAVGEGLAVAITKAIQENRSLQTITNREVRQGLGYNPAIYGYRTGSFQAVSTLERRFGSVNYERDYLEQAQAFLEAGNYAETSRVLSRAITLEPDNPETYYLRGNALLNLQIFDLARADFSEAIRLDPQMIAAYLHRGYLNTFDNSYNQGAADFEQALKLEADNADAVFGQKLAESFSQSAELNERWSAIALPWLTETIEEQPEFITAYIIRGIAQAESGDLEAAQKDLELAISLQQSQGDLLSASETQRVLDILTN